MKRTFGANFLHGALALALASAGVIGVGSARAEDAKTAATPTPKAAVKQGRKHGGAPMPDKKDIVASLADGKNTKTLAELVKTAGLEETLKGKGPITLFAPTDAAFAKLPKDQLDALKKDTAKLKDLLNLHILPERINGAALKGGAEVKQKSAQGAELTIKRGAAKGTFKVNGVETTPGYRVANGSILPIETVLTMPEKK